MYATSDIFAKDNMNITNIEQPASQNANEYVHALYIKVSQRVNIYHKYLLRRTIIEGLNQWTGQYFEDTELKAGLKGLQNFQDAEWPSLALSVKQSSKFPKIQRLTKGKNPVNWHFCIHAMSARAQS